MTDKRYSDEELEEFRQLIDRKLQRAIEDFEYLQEQISELGQSADGDHAADYIDGSAAQMDIQRLNEMARRQLESIEDLEAAKVRIRQGIYGICSVTGQRIDPMRLRLVPSARRSVEGEKLVDSGMARDKDLSELLSEI